MVAQSQSQKSVSWNKHQGDSLSQGHPFFIYHEEVMNAWPSSAPGPADVSLEAAGLS